MAILASVRVSSIVEESESVYYAQDKLCRTAHHKPLIQAEVVRQSHMIVSLPNYAGGYRRYSNILSKDSGYILYSQLFIMTLF